MGAAFRDRLEKLIKAKRSHVCVGLDPRYGRLPAGLRSEIENLTDAAALRTAEVYRRFCRGVIEAVAPYAVAVKPQLAFFEAAGPAALGALTDVIDYAGRHELLVIADAKRGDIGSTATAYASAFLEDSSPFPVDAMTVNPYLGADAVEPFLETAAENGRGVYVLVRTSNPGSADLQSLELTDGRPLWRAVAEMVARWSAAYPGAVGWVFGATQAPELTSALELLGDAPLLLPGYGAQGAGVADVAAALDGPALVNSSRGIIFAFEDSELNWRQAVARAALKMQEDLSGKA